MGSFFSKLKKLFASEDEKILLLGLDGAGKTTLLYQLQLGEVISTVPTIGFNVEHVEFNRCTMTVWDVGGQSKVRALWGHYFTSTTSLIYVIDSSDTERIEEAAEELHRVMSDESMKKIKALLIFANKQDVKGSLDAKAISKKLALDRIHVPSYVQPCVATQKDGIFDGMVWLTEQCNKAKK